MAHIERPLFHSARLKIERANQHIKELIRVLNTFPQTGLHYIGSEEDPETTGVALKIQVKDEMLDKIVLIIGDAIHNLRTALDHVAHELVILSGGTPTTSTRFPFGKRRQEIIPTIHGVIQGIPLDIVTCIVECIQPYRGGNDDLYALHALDIADKHRLIVPIFSAIGVKVRAKDDGGSPGYLVFAIERGEKMRTVYPRAGAKIEGYDKIMLQILFDDVEGFKGRAVVKTLRQLRQIVRAVVEEIERAYRDSRKPHPL